ncbi:putative histone acetyltransferase [Helianthus debilis subsp. tardiflorus]
MMDLLDMEAALPDGARRRSMESPKWRSAWCVFVKSATIIYEIVEATLALETMIKTEYINTTWWWY